MVIARIHDFGFMTEGHADYDDYGYDIVCSAISALTQTIAIALEKYCKAKVTATRGNIIVDLDERSEISHILLNTLRLGLHEIREEYPDHLQIQVKRGVFMSEDRKK